MSPVIETVSQAVDLGLLSEATFRMAVVVGVGLLSVCALSALFRRWDP